MSFDHPWLLLLLVLPLALALGWPGRPQGSSHPGGPAGPGGGPNSGGSGGGRPLLGRLGRGGPGGGALRTRGARGPARPAVPVPLPWWRWTRPGPFGPAFRPRLPRPGRLLRVLAMACLVLALAGPSLPLPARGLAVAVVVDRSASMEPVLDQVAEVVNDVLTTAAGTGPGGDPVQVALVSAGSAAAVERSPRPLPQPVLSAWTTPAHREATDLAAALRVAAGSLPPDHRRRVVLISDGRATQGDALAEARALAAAGIVLDTVAVDPHPAPDLAVTGVDAPATARPGRPVAVQVTVRAQQPGPARLHLLAGDEAVASRSVQLAAGENRFVLTVTPRRPGPLPLRAVVEAVPPSTAGEPANDAFDAVIQVEGARPVLVLSPQPEPALARLLRSQGIPVESRTPGQRPADLAGWGRYGAVVLDNLPAHQLGEAAMGDLERFVRDLGGGLVMAGLPDTFGPGGYTGTPVERALPVHTDLRSRKNLPTVALTLVIDRSGSMQGIKLQMAVEAALRVAQLLTPADRLAVVLFDSQAYVTRPLEPVRDPAEVARAFPAAAEGGTALGNGLAAALPLMEGVGADVRHVIALTDGVSEPFDVGGVARSFRQRGITVSAVAIGTDADRATLALLAREGGGALYEAADPGQLPSLITRDTALSTRRFIVDDPFVPVVTAVPAPGGPGAVLQGLVPAGAGGRGRGGAGTGGGAPGGETGVGTGDGGTGGQAGTGPTPGAPAGAGGQAGTGRNQGAAAGAGDRGLFPPLGGYVLTTPKDRAEVLLASNQGDPVLAAWFYGLGRAVAWTAPTAGQGVAAWTDDAGGASPFARLWANVADWLLGDAPGGPAPWRVTARATAAGTVTVTVEGSPPLSGRVRVGDAEAPLLPVAADRSEAVVPVAEPGVYPVVVEPAPGPATSGPAGSGPGGSGEAAGSGAGGAGEAAGSGAVAGPGAAGPGTAAPAGSGEDVPWAPLRATVAVPYPAEFLQTGGDPVLMETLAALTGGRAARLDGWDPRTALDPAGVPAPPGRLALWPYLLLAAALLLPADVAARRLGWEWPAGGEVSARSLGAWIRTWVRLAGSLEAVLRRGRRRGRRRAWQLPDPGDEGPALRPEPAGTTKTAGSAGTGSAGGRGGRDAGPVEDTVTLGGLVAGRGDGPAGGVAVPPGAGVAGQPLEAAGSAGSPDAGAATPVESPVESPAQDVDLARLQAARRRSRVRTAERLRRHLDPPAGP